MNIPDSLQWCLIGLTDATGDPTRIVVKDEGITVGRLSDCNVCIPRRIVSGTHARLYIDNEKLYVTDQKSTNGTYVNGEQVHGTALLERGDLVQFADEVFRVNSQLPSRDDLTIEHDSTDAALAAVQFDKLIKEPAVVPFFQPIVPLQDRSLHGYEVLGRSRLVGLASPAIMFATAAKFSMEAELSRMFRTAGVQAGRGLNGRPLLFLNTHPVELKDVASLERSLRALRDSAPELSIALEIHEAAVTNSQSIQRIRHLLNDLDMLLAYDDFGHGQARLREIAEDPPHYIKFDMSLIRDIHLASSNKQRLLARLVEMTLELGVEPLAEGVELEAEHDVCREIGFTFGQGFLYGKPASVKSTTRNRSENTECVFREL